MEAIVVAVISAASAIVVALINARASRQRTAGDAAERSPSAGRRRGALSRGWTSLWDAFARLPPLERRTRPLLAAFLGFALSGFGIALYFRKGADVLVGIVLAVPLLLAAQGERGGAETETEIAPWYWPFAALAAAYGVLRSESANRRLEETGA